MNKAYASPPLTLYQQLSALPENLTGEIIDGELYTQPRPSGRHALTERSLTLELAGPFDKGRGGPGGWWIIPEPEIHFIRDTVVAVPDLAGWRRERMPDIPEGHRFEVVPDWVCEILSPSTLQKYRSKKMPLYAQFGVAYAWLVDPLAHLLEAYTLTEGGWLLIAKLKDGDAVTVPPFDAVGFALSDLWA